MMTLDDFIEKNIKLFEDHNYSQIYLNTLLQEQAPVNVGKLTALLDQIEERPLDYMRRIPDYFLYAQSIKQFDIPSQVHTIEDGAFQNSQLESIHVPGHILVVGDNAFNTCTNLKSIQLDDGIRMLGVNAFRRCPITKIDFPASITDIGMGCFGQTSLQECILPSITSIPDYLFAYCSYLTKVVIPTSVTKIGESVFIGSVSLERLIYEGTLKQWYAVHRHAHWNKSSFAREVICSDGVDRLS